MKATDLTKNITTEGLLAQFESRFGQTMNLQGLAQEQLEDMANVVRTKIHEITNNQHFGQELKDDNYHKHQMMLDILNQAVKESAGGINTQVSPQQQALAKKIQTVSGIKPQDKDAIIGAMVQKETAVKEGIENQSELILAAKDMMDKVTGYLEDLATMKTESMLELSDRIRDEMGADKAEAFMQKVKPALESAEQTLTSTRTELDQAVRILTGEELASTEPMGALDEPLDSTGDELDSLNAPAGDEFASADANAGGTEPEGRQKRESREVFEASTRIYSRLAGK
ncbi:hypothetical protein EB001_05880 [bacterium]|nr:hypothetical protein [bacterium]